MQSAGSDKLISVIIPVYIKTEEGLGWLREAAESVLAQTTGCVRLILADDGSPVSIGPLLKDLPGDTVYFRNSRNLRQAGARQKGVEAASGDICAFLDQDDVWKKDYLEKQLAVMEEKQADMVFCDPEFVTVGGADSPVLRMDRSGLPEESSFLSLFLRGNYVISFSGAVIKKQALLAAGGMDVRYTSMDDYDLFLKISERGRVIHNAAPLYRYRIHPGAANRSVRLYGDSRLLMSLYLGHFKKSSAGEKRAMAPRLIKKALALVYYGIFNK
ncbi:MAG: glycosyltransferase [Abditibacteriota bacterium]|nr:glycosyltransferase [Abditibacteriota bacterium]